MEGTIRLENAIVHGILGLHGPISHPENKSLVAANAVTVDGAVFLDGLRTTGGRVNFTGATLGSIFAEECQLNNPGEYSLTSGRPRRDRSAW